MMTSKSFVCLLFVFFVLFVYFSPFSHMLSKTSSFFPYILLQPKLDDTIKHEIKESDAIDASIKRLENHVWS